MADFVYNLNDYLLFFLICGIFIAFSIIGFLIIYRFTSLEVRGHGNEAIVGVSATICIIYAVLFGFIALYTLENFDKAERSALQEAGLLTQIYHDSKLLPQPFYNQVRADLKNYLHEVLIHEWPAMIHNKSTNGMGEPILFKMEHMIHRMESSNNRELFSQQEILKEIKSLYEIRQERIYMSGSALGTDFWIVIIIGAFLTISVNYLFGLHFYVHLITIIGISLAISSIFYLIVVLDRPYSGEFSVKPEVFQLLLNTINSESKLGE